MKLTANNGKAYEIAGNKVTTENGKTYTVSKCEAAIPAHVIRMLKGKQVPAGYVWSGEVLLPREVAEAAMAQAEAAMAQAEASKIEGIDEIGSAALAYEIAFDNYRTAIARGTHIPAAPTRDKIKALKAQFPRAAAWHKADAYAHSYNASKAAAGRNARARIENGEDYQIAIAEMDSEWTAAAEAATDNN
jgi:hypothetical protein